MPYVPQDVKERIKREVSIQRLAEARGIKLTRSGKELIGLCPFHDDHNPSLNIDPVKNVWNCKGACGEGGDLFLWVMRAEGVLQRTGRDYPALSPDRVLLAQVPLGQTPSLHLLRRRCSGFVRRLPRYYGSVRLPVFVHHRLQLLTSRCVPSAMAALG
jgi:hypothetical protein